MGDDLIAHCLRQTRPAGHAIDQGIGLAPIEPTEGLHGYRRMIDPGELRVGPRCDHQQQSHVPDLLDDAGQQFQRGGIRPVQVLDDREHRGFVSQPFELSQDRRKGSLLASLRRELCKLLPRAGTGSDSRSAISANSSADAPGGSNAASLRSFVAASSSRSNPAARASWPITGCSNVSW